jgi:hypothetical protein
MRCCCLPDNDYFLYCRIFVLLSEQHKLLGEQQVLLDEQHKLQDVQHNI